MANFLQLDLDGYNNPSVLKHLGAAIVAIAADLEKECAAQPKDRCGCAEPTLDEIREEADYKAQYAEEFVERSIPPDGTISVVYGAPPPPAMPPLPTPPAPPTTIFGMNVIVDPSLPPGSVQMVGGGQSLTVADGVPAPPAPHTEVIEDDETGWPDPPGGVAPTTDLDSAGIPWDVRIHAGSKARMKADNTWKLKPGVDKALVEQVKAELLGVQAVPVPPAPPVTLADAAAVSTVPQAPPPPPAPVSNCPANFAELIKEVTTRITAGTMTADQVNAACVTVGLQMCNQLAARPDLIQAVWSVLCPTHA